MTATPTKLLPFVREWRCRLLTPPTSHAAVLRLQLKREVAKLKQQLNHGNAGDHDVRAAVSPWSRRVASTHLTVL